MQQTTLRVAADAQRRYHTKGVPVPLPSKATYLLCLFTACCGCGQSSPPATQPSPVVSQPSIPVTEPAVVTPHHTRVEVFINNHKFGDTNGCTTTFSPQATSAGTKIERGSTCGHPGAVSKLTWSYLRSDEKGDHYEFERVFPHGEPNQETTKKKVIFTGRDVVLFEDETQRVVFRLAPPPD